MVTTAVELEPCITAREVALLLRCSVRSVHRLVRTGALPRPLRMRRLLWRASTIRQFLDSLDSASDAIRQPARRRANRG